MNGNTMSCIRIRKDKMAETEINCEPCQREDIKKRATVYCYECSERMCDGCKLLHKKMKILAGHKLVKIEDKKEDIAKLDYLKSLTQCSEHDTEEVKYICKDHDQLCCNECAIKHHRKCERMVTIVSEQTAAENDTKDIKLRLEELEQFTDKLVDYEKKHQTIVEKSQTAVKDKLVQLKKTVEDAYKQLEERINTDVEEKGKLQLKKCATQRQEVGKLKTEIKRSRDKLGMVSEYNKNVCAYLIARDLEKDMKEHEAALSALHTKTSKACLYVTETRTPQELIKTISNCIHVKEKFSVDDIPVCPGFIGVGTRGTKGEPVMICEHKLSLTTGYARSCIWIGNFVVVALQEMKEIQIFENANINIKFHAKTAVSSEPWSLARIDNVRFAICFPHNKTVQTMKIDNGLLRVLSTFSTNHDVWDITYNCTDDQLITLSRAGMIDIYKLNGKSVGTIPLNGDLFTAVRNSFTICYDSAAHALYISSQGLHKMVAVDMKGKVLFEYKHPKLQYPRRPDVDTDGNIYVPCYGGDTNSSMHELDKAGKLVREIRLSGAGFCVSFDLNRTKFVVCCDEHAEPYIQIYGFK